MTVAETKKSHVMVLGDDDLQVIAAALNELPRKHSEPVLQRLQAQLDAEAKVEAEDAARSKKVKELAEKELAAPTTSSRARRG